MNDFIVEDNQAVLTDALRTRKHSWHFSIVAQGTPRWKVAGVARTHMEDTVDYIQLVGRQAKAKYSGYLGTQGDPRRPNALFIIKVIQSGPFTSSLNCTRWGGWVETPEF